MSVVLFRQPPKADPDQDTYEIAQRRQALESGKEGSLAADFDIDEGRITFWVLTEPVTLTRSFRVWTVSFRDGVSQRLPKEIGDQIQSWFVRHSRGDSYAGIEFLEFMKGLVLTGVNSALQNPDLIK